MRAEYEITTKKNSDTFQAVMMKEEWLLLQAI